MVSSRKLVLQKPNAGDRLAKHVAVCASKEKVWFLGNQKTGYAEVSPEIGASKNLKIPGMKDEEIAMDVTVMFQDVSSTPHI